MSLVKKPFPVVTVSQLPEELKTRGISVTRRGLRAWWTEGLLPRPTSQGRGRAKGKISGWHDLDIIDRAVTVSQLKQKRARFQYAHHLELFSLGYAVESRTLRASLLSWLEYVTHCVLRGKRSGPAHIANQLFDLSHRVGRDQARRTGLRHRDVEQLVYAVLSVVFSPSAPCERDLRELAATADRWMTLRAAPHLNWPHITPTQMKKFLKWLHVNASLEMLRDIAYTAEEKQYQTAQEIWKRCREVLGHAVEAANNNLCDAGELRRISVQLSLLLGGVALLALIWFLGCGYEEEGTAFIEWTNELLRGEKRSLWEAAVQAAYRPANREKAASAEKGCSCAVHRDTGIITG